MTMQATGQRCKLARCLRGTQAPQSGPHWLKLCRQAGCFPAHGSVPCLRSPKFLSGCFVSVEEVQVCIYSVTLCRNYALCSAQVPRGGAHPRRSRHRARRRAARTSRRPRPGRYQLRRAARGHAAQRRLMQRRGPPVPWRRGWRDSACQRATARRSGSPAAVSDRSGQGRAAR